MYWTSQKKMVLAGTGSHKYEDKDLAGSWKVRTLGRRKRLENFCPLTCMKQKQVYEKKGSLNNRCSTC
jgi:hypothetical protein